MNRLLRSVLVAGLVIVLLAGCGKPALAPLTFSPAPWQDGEISTYIVRGRSGVELGTAQWTWRRTADGWLQAYELSLGGRLDRGEVLTGADLSMRNSWREAGGTRYKASYAADGIAIVTTTAGTPTTKTLEPAADSIDNDASLQVQRALPLGKGYATRYTVVIPTTGLAVPVRLAVTSAQTVTVPAGTFATWQVELSFGSGKHDAWYSQEEPYPLVQYRNRASGAVFELKSIGSAAGGPAPAPSADAPIQTAPVQSGPPPFNAPLLLTTFLIQMPLMLGLPVLIGWWIRRRYGIGWGVFGIGAATFIASQVVHLPLNFALGLLGGGRGAALWPLAPLAVVAGLSAGICEEGARWLVLRFLAKKTRGWRAGLQFGAGHGGAEAIIFGMLALVNVVAMIALRSLDPAILEVAGAEAGQVRTALAEYWGTAAFLPVVAGLERVFAITLHIALAALVMRAITRNRPLYLVAAIALHTATNAWAVWAMQTSGMWITEGGVALVALFSLWVIRRLREAPPAPDSEPATAPAPTAAGLARRTLSAEELARRAESSQYE